MEMAFGILLDRYLCSLQHLMICQMLAFVINIFIVLDKERPCSTAAYVTYILLQFQWLQSYKQWYQECINYFLHANIATRAMQISNVTNKNFILSKFLIINKFYARQLFYRTAIPNDEPKYISKTKQYSTNSLCIIIDIPLIFYAGVLFALNLFG